jgi:ParB family chromosome partitioning protein
MTLKKRGLGKGLEALLGTSQVARQKQIVSDIQADAAQNRVDNQTGELQTLPITWLRPGKYQPRRDMSQEALEDLANSIRAQGVIQPIVVRRIADQQYEIIAGERRWRASQLVRLETVPCLIKNVEDNAAVAIALIENIQREDLNAIEEAVALQRLMTEFELSHQQVAEAVGKSRSAVSNLLRLNQLNDDVKQLVEHGDLDMGHARALLSLAGELQSDTARTDRRGAERRARIPEHEQVPSEPARLSGKYRKTVRRAGKPELCPNGAQYRPGIEAVSRRLYRFSGRR